MLLTRNMEHVSNRNPKPNPKSDRPLGLKNRTKVRCSAAINLEPKNRNQPKAFHWWLNQQHPEGLMVSSEPSNVFKTISQTLPDSFPYTFPLPEIIPAFLNGLHETVHRGINSVSRNHTQKISESVNQKTLRKQKTVFDFLLLT